MGRDISVYPLRTKIRTCIHSQLEQIVIFLASFGGEDVFINNLCMVDGCQAVILDLQGVRAD